MAYFAPALTTIMGVLLMGQGLVEAPASMGKGQRQKTMLRSMQKPNIMADKREPVCQRKMLDVTNSFHVYMWHLAGPG